MHILGVSCYYHDAAAALLRDGQLIAAAEEERFSRIKHDFSFPRRAIQFCLDSAGINGREIDYVIFFEKPFRKLERILSSVLQTYPRSWKVFRESMIGWLLDKVWVAETLQSELGIDRRKVLFSEHHLSHAASAFLCSPFDEAAILTVDGVGEWCTTAWGTGRGNQVQLMRQTEFPHSVGLLYSAFTAFLGFQVNEGEYKVMGMAAYGKPRYTEKIWRVVRQNSDGSFALDMDYFCFQHSTDRMFNGRFTELFGEPRALGTSSFSQEHADVAASIQQVTEELLLGMVRNLRKETGLTKLCIAGGVGLNSVANGRIMRETEFEELYVQPAAGDAGGALGAALWAHYSLLGNARSFRMEHAYWGQEYSPSEISAFLGESNIPHRMLRGKEDLLDTVVEELVNGKVVGWFQGRFEWGPRALGNRSILADPRNAEVKNIVNAKIKFREPFRPFAPAVPVDRAERYFELPNAAQEHAARFMLRVAATRECQRAVIPGVTHVDGSARVQTVFREHNPLYYDLIERFGEATGVPVLLNTSMNLNGEPMVNTPQEAVSTFMRSGMDCLVLGNFALEKPCSSTTRRNEPRFVASGAGAGNSRRLE